MTPMYSDDPPDRTDKPPVQREGIHRFAISSELLVRVRGEGALLIRENDWKRYLRTIRNLEGTSSHWVAAMWALLGIAASLAGIAVTVSGTELLMFVGFAWLCVMGAAGCFVANRQVNKREKNAAEELAAEMEAAADMDRIEIVPLPPGASPPPGQPSS